MKAYSPNPEINSTIHTLLALGLPPLPVAPKQDPRKEGCHHQSFIEQRFKQPNPRCPEIQGDYCRITLTKVGDDRAAVKGDYCRLDEDLQPIPRFTGKNPSYLDWQGKARPVLHRTYQDQLPTEAELKKWFCNPATGVGTLGGHSGIDWLDFDAKNYASQEECDRDVEAVRARVGASWVERTGSGGWRIAVRPEQRPTFTNFSTDPSGDRHIGEALYEGRFTVLAPTIHPNGNAYRRIEWGEPVTVESLESIGIYPTKDEIANQARAEKRAKSGNAVPQSSSPDDNPWDMRHLSEYLEGYRIEGDFIECKCPAHSGYSDNSLSINLHSGAFWCWSGCDGARILKEAKQIAVAGGYQPPKAAMSKPVPKDIYRLSLKPDIELCDRYFPDVAIPVGTKLIAVKGAKGTGKTELIAKIAAQAHAEGKRVLLLTFREQLGQQSAVRLAIPYLVEVRKESNGKGVALCWDSAHPASAIAFEGADWQDAVIIIDESESVLWHGLNSSTCAKNRQPILKQIQILLSGALSADTQGQVFCLDADLSDLSIETVRSLGGRPELQPYVVLNTYQIKKGELYHYASNEELLGKCESELGSGKHIVLVGAQKASSKFSSTNLEKRWRKLYPGKKILRIDSKTIADPEHPAYLCTKSINRVLLDYDIIIVTSVLECGVSIDIYNHFSGVWGFFGAGVLPENSVRQFLSRLRDFEVPRHCHFAEAGCNFAYVGDRSHDPKTLIESEIRLGRKNAAALLMGGIEVDVDGSVKNNAAALTAWGKFGARLNSTFANYRAVILAGLSAEGYQIEQVAPVIPEPELDNLKAEIKALRTESHAEQAEAVATLGDEPQSEREYELLKEKRAKTEAEHCAERRYELRQRYGLPVTPELVLRDDNGWFSFLRVQYLLTVSDQALVKQESNRLESIVHEGKVFAPDVNRRSTYAKVDLLKKLGATVLLNPEREFTAESLEVQTVAAIALANAAEVKLVLGITVTEKSTAMAICQEILAQTVGFRLKFQQRRIDGKQVRFYSYAHCLKDEKLSADLAERQRVFDAWREREEQRSIEVSHEKLNKILLTDSSVTCDAVTQHEAWLAPGALEDAKATLDTALDEETRAVVLELLPEHIRAVVTRDRPRFKTPGDRPRRPKARTTPRPTHLRPIPSSPTQSEVSA